MENTGRTGKSRFWLGVLAGSVTALAAVAVVLGGYRGKKIATELTDSEPAPYILAQPDSEVHRTAMQELNALRKAIEERSEAEFSFSGEQLSAIVASAPECESLQNQVRFDVRGNSLVALTSQSLDSIPTMKGRFLNAEFTLTLTYENDYLEISVEEGTVKGDPVHPLIMKRVEKIDLARKIYEIPEAVRALERIETIEINGGMVNIRTRGKLDS